MLSGVFTDLRQVVRGLLANRTFAIVAVLSLAIGIGANAAIFSVIRVLLLDRLPVRLPEELSLVYWHQPGKLSISQTNSSGHQDPATGLPLRSNFSYPLYRDLIASLPPGVGAFGFNFMREVAVGYADQSPLNAGGLLADGAYFSVLGPRMALGRPLGEADDVEGGPLAAVISHSFWMRAFGGDPAIVGKPIRVNNVPAEVVGVTAAEFRGLSKGGFFPQTEITLPLQAAQALNPRWVGNAEPRLLLAERHFWVRVISRAAASVDAGATRRRLADAMAPRLGTIATETNGAPPSVFFIDGSRGVDQTAADTRKLLLILMGVVGVVLIIACVNLASLSLARGTARQREFAVRRALGASRPQLIRGVLLEGLVLAGVGGSLGLLLTWLSRRILTTALTAGLGTAPLSTQPLEVTVDWRLAVATYGVSVLAALLFSLLPAWRLTRRAGTAELRQRVVGARTPKLTIGRVLVALQIAVSVPLLVGAVLFLRTVANLGRVDLGFNPQDLAFFKIDPAVTGVAPPEHAGMFLDLLNRLGAVPGVTSVTLIENALLSGWTSNNRATVNGKDQMLYMNAVGPGFLDTMGMRLLAGRAPGIQDRPGSPAVAALNESAARQLFGDVSPVGQDIVVGSRTVQIVGVVSDALYDRQRASVRATMFDSALQRAGYGGHHVVVRAAVPIETLEPALRRAVAEVHRDLPVPAFKTQLAQMRETTIRERVFAQLLTIFGGFALLLAIVGLHGVTAYTVARRTSEIGLRMALGAQRRQVLWLIERQVVVLAIAGLAIGVPIAIALAPLVGSLLFGVAPTDRLVIVVSASVMLIAAVSAGFLPARRAATIDPLRALRSE
jgi:predicted permease